MVRFPSAGLRRERVQASPNRRDGRFRNLSGAVPRIKGNPLPVLGEYFFGGGRRTPPAPLPVDSPLERWARRPDGGLRVTWLGHSTVLLEVDGLRVLTDPVFGKRASPLAFAGPRRFHPAPVRVAELPALDAVLVSHDHYDHLCAETIGELARRDVRFVTALGVGARLEGLGVAAERITELDWHERADLGGLRFVATPAQHFSGRGVGDRNQTLWASWVIETERHRLFFSGDTGLFAGFAAIGRQHGPFDLVLLEVGAFHPAWDDIHLGPENALRALELLGGGALLPVHWGTFNLALHDWDEPAETLLRLGEARGTRLVLPRLGAPVEPAQVERPVPWWRAVGRAAAERDPAPDLAT
jgi:L-ascorbate metabolism protein UlaG (beta-lactamase superfamily)